MGKGSSSLYQKPAKNAGPTEAEKTANAENGQVGGEPINHEMMARHNLDRHTMHSAHEHEHAMHKGGDKKEMHDKHSKEHKAMLKKHDDEMGTGREDAMTKGAKIESEG